MQGIKFGRAGPRLKSFAWRIAMMTSEGRATERRRHKMYVTRNTEYHFRDGVCVAVRDRTQERWLVSHSALRRAISGAVRFRPDGEASPCVRIPRVGDALFFGTGGPDVVTSRLTAIDRPAKTLVASYPL